MGELKIFNGSTWDTIYGVKGETGMMGVTGPSGGSSSDPTFNSVTISGANTGESNLISPVRYGVDDAPAAAGTPYGTIYYQYVS
jgi:hypothetical protein